MTLGKSNKEFLKELYERNYSSNDLKRRFTKTKDGVSCDTPCGEGFGDNHAIPHTYDMSYRCFARGTIMGALGGTLPCITPEKQPEIIASREELTKRKILFPS